MALGDPVAITIPAVGSAGTQYATDINNSLQAIKDVLETKNTNAGLNITSAFDISNEELDNVFAARFDNLGATLTAGTDTRKIYMASGEWYLNDAAGNQVQVTASGSLNAASIGGIVGDYGGADPAKVTYIDVSSVYVFTTDPGIYADVQMSDCILTDTGAGGFIKLKCPAIAGNYSITFPTAAPGSTLLMQMASSGAITTSNSVATMTVTSNLVMDSGSATIEFDSGTLAAAGATITGTPLISQGFKTLASFATFDGFDMGTFTPIIHFDGVEPLSYGDQEGFYFHLKTTGGVGVVFVSIQLNIDNTNTSSPSVITIPSTGLPFGMTTGKQMVLTAGEFPSSNSELWWETSGTTLILKREHSAGATDITHTTGGALKVSLSGFYQGV